MNTTLKEPLVQRAMSPPPSKAGSHNTGLTRKAADAFHRGEYAEALSLYRRAGRYYGEALFRANIILCERRLDPSRPVQDRATPPTSGPALKLEQQLEETQRLLEHYYTRAQELEHQLMDRK